MRVRLGATGAIAVRSLLAAAALLVTLAASLILARKLPEGDYAAYQALTKRAFWLASLPALLMGDWVYRYAAQGIAGTWEALRLLALVTGAWGAAVGFTAAVYVGVRGPAALLLAAVALSLLPLQSLYRLALSALRPVRIALLQLAYRATYAALVAVLVYLLHQGLRGALAAAAAASLAAVVLFEASAAEVKPGRGDGLSIVGEWARHMKPQVLAAAAVTVNNLDALIVIGLAGGTAVAGYFAANIAPSVMREALTWGLGYISAIMLRGLERGFTSSFTLVSSLTAPLAAFIIAYPEHIIYLVNPRYSWAEHVLPVLAVAAYVGTYEAYTANLVSGVARGRAWESAAYLEAVRGRILAVNTAYATLVALAAYTLRDSPPRLALLWAATFLAASLARSAVYTRMLPSQLRRAALSTVKPMVLSLALSLAATLALSPLNPQPSPRFFEELRRVTPFAAAVGAVALAAQALTPSVRRLYSTYARRFLHLLKSI